MPTVSNKNNLDVRLSVTETKVANIQGDLVDQKDVLKDIYDKVNGLKERFDKMNGALPHIQESCSNIEKHLEEVAKANNEQENKITKNSLYIKLMWGLSTPIMLAIVGTLVKVVFFGK